MSLAINIDVNLETVKHIFSNKPRFLLSSDTIKSDRPSSYVEYFNYGIHRKHISYNDPKIDRIDFLMFDIDRHSDFSSFPSDFPIPLATVIQPNKGSFHHIYRLKTPVLTGLNARPKPRRLLNAVQRFMTLELDADPNYSNRLAKNAANSNFNVILRETEDLDLGSLVHWLDDTVSLDNRFREAKFKEKAFGYGRNDDLFIHTSVFARNLADRGCYSYEEMFYELQAYNSSFAVPLLFSEYRYTATSIHRWISSEYIPKNKRSNRNRYTKQAEKETETLKIIVTVIENMNNSGVRLTPDKLAGLCGISISTLHKYMKKYEVKI